MAVALREMRASRQDVTWKPRPATALAVRLAAVGLPVLVAFTAATVVGRLLQPVRTGLGIWTWRAVVVVIATATAFVAERGLRRMLSLSALLKLSLVFPDHAPSRYSIALRTGTPRQLRSRLDDLSEHGLPPGEQGAATRLLELVGALNAHDRLTRGHSSAYGPTPDSSARSSRSRADDLERLNWAALLHDIGKLEVPADILGAPGRAH